MRRLIGDSAGILLVARNLVCKTGFKLLVRRKHGSWTTYEEHIATNSKARPNGWQLNKCVITLKRRLKTPKKLILPHSFPQRPPFFWSASKTVTSGRAQVRKSAIHGLPVILHMLKIKSDWFWSQSIVSTKPFKTGNVVGPGQRSTAVKWVRMLEPRARTWEWIASFP